MIIKRFFIGVLLFICGCGGTLYIDKVEEDPRGLQPGKYLIRLQEDDNEEYCNFFDNKEDKVHFYEDDNGHLMAYIYHSISISSKDRLNFIGNKSYTEGICTISVSINATIHPVNEPDKLFEGRFSVYVSEGICGSCKDAGTITIIEKL